MTRALLKKQMMETFAWIYMDRKRGTSRSRKSLAINMLRWLFVFGYLSVMSGVNAMKIVEPLVAADMGWLYWCLMGSAGIVFGVVASVFVTYGTLYKAKDNDTLLSMPIPLPQLIVARLSSVYAIGLFYLLIVMVPTILVWLLKAPLSPLGVVFILLIPLVAGLFILVISAIIGWIVALIASRVRRKNVAIVIVSLGCIAAYFYFCANAVDVIVDILENPLSVSTSLRSSLSLLYHMGRAAEGDVVAMLIFTSIIAVMTGITYQVLEKSFLNIATTNRGSVKTVYRQRRSKVASIGRALWIKELRRFTSSAVYMLNCGMGIVAIPVISILFIWKIGLDEAAMNALGEIEILSEAGALAIAVSSCLLATMIDITAPSVSLEGRNIWITQSLPIPTRDILRAKISLHFELAFAPMVIYISVCEWILKIGLVQTLLVHMIAALFILLLAQMGLALNLKMPSLSWTSEVMPIKHSGPVFIVIFGGWAIIAMAIGIYALLANVGMTIHTSIFLGCVMAMLVIIDILLYTWIMSRGAQIYEELG